VASLVGILLTLVGLWTFDHFWVPPEHARSAPYVRLNHEFCGIPAPETWFLAFMSAGCINASVRLVAGEGDAAKQARESFTGIALPLLVLPVLSSLLPILSRYGRRGQMIHAAAWALAGIGLLIGVSSHPRLFWALFGLWLHIGMATSALGGADSRGRKRSTAERWGRGASRNTMKRPEALAASRACFEVSAVIPSGLVPTADMTGRIIMGLVRLWSCVGRSLSGQRRRCERGTCHDCDPSSAVLHLGHL
jgi:hypothetical protein